MEQVQCRAKGSTRESGATQRGRALQGFRFRVLATWTSQVFLDVLRSESEAIVRARQEIRRQGVSIVAWVTEQEAAQSPATPELATSSENRLRPLGCAQVHHGVRVVRPVTYRTG